MRNYELELDCIERMMMRICENDFIPMNSDDCLLIRNSMQLANMNDQIESLLERIDQEALSKVSYILMESIVKRLEYQMNNGQLSQCKLCLLLFNTLSMNSKRFRDTIHRSHTIHLWLGLLRTSLQWDSHILLADTLVTIRNVIKEINTAFSTEYVYWKKFIPELADLMLQCKRKYQFPIFEQELRYIFYNLLKDDYTFLAHAHSQMDNKKFFTLIQCTAEVANNLNEEFEWSNYLFCKQLFDEIGPQHYPTGTSVHERRAVIKLVKDLELVWDQRVHRVEDQAISASSDSESSGDGESEEIDAQGQPLQQQKDSDDEELDEQAVYVHNPQMEKNQQHPAVTVTIRHNSTLPLISNTPYFSYRMKEQQQQRTVVLRMEENKQQEEKVEDEEQQAMEEMTYQRQECHPQSQQQKKNSSPSSMFVDDNPGSGNGCGHNGAGSRKRVAAAAVGRTEPKRDEDGGGSTEEEQPQHKEMVLMSATPEQQPQKMTPSKGRGESVVKKKLDIAKDNKDNMINGH